ncbi:hemolysin family protein [Dyadobacter tibetensis]|uniref:hemolysin family protein n=1 Tax=Dyadobacter tibetensis TaxID=1211851 RepID=UPI00047288D9|nr:hemolysin family protein [Dyadobacter tibetensis]
MNAFILIITFGFFLLAGYYGAVRSILSELSLDRYMMRYDKTEELVKALYWRRILRMARLMVVALGVFFTVACLSPLIDQYWHLALWINVLILFVVMAVCWLFGYTLWVKLARIFPGMIALTNFPVRFAEWFITPIYWLVEPFVKDNILSTSYRDDAASADDPDFEDHSIEERMFINALDFKDLRIRDCMIPRTEISALNVTASIEDLRKAFLSSGHSKIIIYRDSVDNILGYCHALALFKKPKEIASIITPILIVPEAMPVRDLMLKFLEERRSIALVVDEFGGTSGLVSVEDVVEQIFGEIQDEYDSTEDWTERKVDEDTYIFSARHEIDYLNDKYGWELPEGDYDTLAGMFIDHYGDLPEVNDVLELKPHLFQVVSMQDTRIELIKISVGQAGS